MTFPALDAVPFTVADFLALPVMQRARPEILAGTSLDNRAVRWVHTSEIYDIAPLLKGNEILLTTGLGLVGASSEAVSYYAASLAQRGIAALILEAGRTFTAPPAALVAAAQQFDLPLIVLRGIVPFIEITEVVHSLLLTRELDYLRFTDDITTTLNTTLLTGSGMGELLRTMATIADCPVRLFGKDGHLVGSSDREPGQVKPVEPDFPQATVELFGHRWGQLVVYGSPSPQRESLAHRGATAAAVELSRMGSATGGAGRQRAGSQLLRDLFGRQYTSADDVAGRAAALGLTIRPGQRAAGICLALRNTQRPTTGSREIVHSSQPATAITSAITAAADSVFHTSLVTELDGSYLIATSIPTDDIRSQLTTLANSIDAALPRWAGSALAVTCGPLVPDIAGLARSLRVARETSVLARRLDSSLRILLASDLGVQRLLSRFTSDPELAHFVDEQLGPLLDYDASRGRDLVHTLDVLIACGLSKTAAAAELGIRRQTLYQRLATASNLLGGLDLESRERRTAIDLALVGWRLRTAAAPGHP